MDTILPKKLNTDTYLDFIKYLRGITTTDDVIIKVNSLTSSGNFLSEYDIYRTELLVSELIPIQSEIDLVKILIKVFNNEVSLLNLIHDEGIKILGFPILTYNNKFIIDGHHRWAQINLFNPNTSISCINIAGISDVEMILCKLQLNVSLHTPENLSGKSHDGINIFKCTKSDIEKILINIPELDKKRVFDILNLSGDIDKSLIDYIFNNIKKTNKPIKGSLNREDMPQVFDSPPLTSILNT